MMGPPFISVHQGMEFAFSNAPGCGSNFPNMTSARSTHGLSRLDVRAQAGQVQCVIDRLAPDEKLWVMLVYGPKDDAARYALDLVPSVISHLPSGAYHTRLIADLILWNCGRRDFADMSVRKMAKKVDVSVWKVMSLGAKVGRVMQTIGIGAFNALERDFETHEWLLNHNIKG